MNTTNFLSEVLLEAIKGTFLIAAAFITFKLVGGRWERQKTAMELSARMAERYWVRLNVLARFLGSALAPELRTAPVVDRQEAFHRLLDFRLTLYRFYEDVSGIYVSRGRQNVKLQIDKVSAGLLTIMDSYDWSRSIDAAASDGHEKLLLLHQTIDQVRKPRSVLASTFKKFDQWLRKEAGKDAGDLGQAFTAYHNALQEMIPSTLTYLK